jgi:glycosyltransferase involved in cell wall biosynthesis
MTNPRRVCSIIARNYWAHARVLARSLAEVHPDAELTVLVVDADASIATAAAREPFSVVCPRSIGLDTDEFRRMAAIYDVMELSTSLKPWLTRWLFERDDSPVVYLDPDIRVFTPLDEAWDLASDHGIVLTPHSLAPLPEDAREPSELTMLVSGIYNLGFIALGAQSHGFIDWWADRLSRNGLNAQPEGMFVDQRWVDLASSYFETHVIRDPGWNVAFWNLPTRDVVRTDGSFSVDGSPLRFFHFSGFDPNRPWRLSRFQGADPRIDPVGRPAIGELCARYATELLSAGYDAHTRVPYGFGRSLTGLRLGEAERSAYRRELIRSEVDGAPEPPNPFDPDEAPEFTRWLRETAGTIPDDAPSGVNIAGYVHAESGVGECARMLIAAVDAARVPRSIVAFDRTDSRQDAPFEGGGDPDHAINIVAVNADQFANFASEHRELFDGRYTIGVWNWEVEKFPDEMAASAALADEIWVASEHTANAVRAAVTKPVSVFPIPIARREPLPRSRAELGLPDGFCFLFCFDFDSVFARKDPIAVIDAFSKAFAPDEGPQLVIKSVRGDAHPAQLEDLRAAASNRPDVHVIDGYLSSDDQHALMAAADAYVSLHRAEGFGLTIAEAMANGKPVVATAYSGNLEFMDDTNSWLVRYDLVPIGPGAEPYPADARWAEPDIAAAATAMREIVADPDEARARGERAASDIARLHAPDVRASFIRDRLERIAKDHPPAPPPAPEPKPAMEPRRPAPSKALAEIRALLERGPDLDSPARVPGVSRRFRSFVMRVLRHHDEHRLLVDKAIIAAIEEMHTFEQEMRDEMWKLYRLEHRTDDVAQKESDLRAQLDEAHARIRDLEGRVRQQRRHIRDLESGG